MTEDHAARLIHDIRDAIADLKAMPQATFNERADLRAAQRELDELMATLYGVRAA